MVNKNQMFFYNDFLNSHEKNLFFNKEFDNYYKNYLPNLVVIIPSKFDHNIGAILACGFRDGERARHPHS